MILNYDIPVDRALPQQSIAAEFQLRIHVQNLLPQFSTSSFSARLLKDGQEEECRLPALAASASSLLWNDKLPGP